MTVSQDVQDLLDYLEDTDVPLNTIELALRLKAAEASSTGSAGTSKATEAKQDDQLVLLDSTKAVTTTVATNTGETKGAVDAAKLVLDAIATSLAALKAIAPQETTDKVKGKVTLEESSTTTRTFTVPTGAYSLGLWLIEGSCSVDGYNIPLDNFISFPAIIGATYEPFVFNLGTDSKIQITESRLV